MGDIGTNVTRIWVNKVRQECRLVVGVVVFVWSIGEQGLVWTDVPFTKIPMHKSLQFGKWMYRTLQSKIIVDLLKPSCCWNDCAIW